MRSNDPYGGGSALRSTMVLPLALNASRGEPSHAAVATALQPSRHAEMLRLIETGVRLGMADTAVEACATCPCTGMVTDLTPAEQICFVGDCGAAQPLFCYNCGYQVGYQMCFPSPPPPPPLADGQEDEASAASMTMLLATDSARSGRTNRTNSSTNASASVS